MNKKFTIYLILIFLLGLASGGIIGATVAKQQLIKALDLKTIGNIVKGEMTRKLDLDATQQQQIDPLVNRATDRIHNIYLETLQKVDGVILDEQNQLETYLRPDQIEKLSLLAKSREEFIRKHNPLEQKK